MGPRDQGQLQAALLDVIGVAVIAIGLNRTVLSWNQAAEELCGWTREEALGERIDSLLLHSDEASFPALSLEMVEWEGEQNLIHRDGTPFQARVRVAAIDAGSGEPGVVFALTLGLSSTESKFQRDYTLARGDLRAVTESMQAGMYTLDANGRVTYLNQVATERLKLELSKLEWVNHIRDALAEDRFVLYAQPIIDLRTRSVVQRELLIRMLEPNSDRGSGQIVPPGQFLPTAEEYGLISEIDRWVITQSAEIAATGLDVEINVSAASISDPMLAGHIDQALARTGADPRRILFEITETALVNDEVAARSFVDAIHAMGCKAALDDFGTGYGGFTYLKHLPIDYLKIDIEFVRDLSENLASRMVVEAIVSLASNFGLQTVAEGVEDEPTLELLGELSVDLAQGFHIARPSPLSEGFIEREGTMK